MWETLGNIALDRRRGRSSPVFTFYRSVGIRLPMVELVAISCFWGLLASNRGSAS